MSCSGIMESYSDPNAMLGYSGNCGQNSSFNTFTEYYYTSGPTYVFETDEMIGNGQERLIFNEDVSQFCDENEHFMPYNSGSEEFVYDSDSCTTLDSYHSDFEFESQFRECQLLVEEELRDMSSMDQSSSVHFEREQIQMQIRRNEELVHQLSPIRKCQSQIQSQQTRKNAENARRKFSLTNGIRPKQRQSNPNSPTTKTTKLSVSVRRWQSEILAKLPFSQQKKDAMNVGPPNVNAPLNQEQKHVNGSEEWQAATIGHFPAKPIPPQRRSSLQASHWSQMKEEYY